MDLKKIFGTTELKTEHAYNKHLEPQLKAEQMDVDAMGCKLYKMCLGYSTWLNETKLTPELVEKLFKGFERRENAYFSDNSDQWFNGVVRIFFSPNRIIFKSPEIMGGCKIQTLADLARLTAAKPILLA